ncbi:NADH dehydrogenase [ubiquinone] 1 alpha subcomplex subunit 2 isoform X1 [Phalacrocorax aristotelis]|uniref:NADH dehydrogenase [ubiquinone] 1 alpha subcomplex subunit 2 isoform X1 n=1 Tax=Phalacrocorax aristotelis TaxID=126867 RepID=UPI003F4C9776
MAAAAAVRGIGGGLGRSLRELRIHLCQRSAGSRGVREFIEQHYVTLKKANPDFPILIRECSGVQPKLWARYGKWGLPAGKHHLRTSKRAPEPHRLQQMGGYSSYNDGGGATVYAARVWQGEKRAAEQPYRG